MEKIGLFYGSSTGNTEHVAQMIQREIGSDLVDLFDVARATLADIKGYDVLILGTSTWGEGELVEDWEGFLPQLDQIDFAGKKVALFGLGDQENYSYNFVDALGILYEKVVQKGATIIGGEWPAEGYDFDASRALVGGLFVGLVIDEDNESEKTQERVKAWVQTLISALKL